MAFRRFFCILFCSFLWVSYVFGQQKDKSSQVETPVKTRILFILDCSSSMWGKWQSDSKIKITQTVLSRFLDSVEHKPNTEVALRVFGHLNKNAYGTRLEVPFEKENILKIRNKLKTLVPKGNCTVATALENSQNDFPVCSHCRNLVVIITDGVDDCEGDICSVAAQVQKNGSIVQTFVIGIGTKENIKANYDCAGPFFSVPNEENFTPTLYSLENLSLTLASVQVNLLDSYGKPTETNVPLLFYDARSGIAKYRFIHTLVSSSTPDTFYIDPLIPYNLEIGTIPPIRIPNVTLKGFEHNTITAKASQGTLQINFAGRSNFSEIKTNFIIREAGKTKTINVQSFNDKQNYLVGKYDLEILTMPPLEIKDVEITPNSVTKLEIPAYGLAIINKGKEISIGKIYMDNGSEFESVCQLDESRANENIYLLPGKYVAIIRSKSSEKTSETLIKEFTIEAGMTTNVVFGKQ